MDDYSDNEYEENSHHLDEDAEDNPILPSPSSGKNVSSSVQEFLKQSNEIQEEIRKLSELCQQISPKKDSDIEEAPKSKEEYDQSAIVWEQINNLLSTHGFSSVVVYRDEYDQECPDITSLSDTVVELITEYSDLSRNFSDIKASHGALEDENKGLKEMVEKAKKVEAQFKDLDKINRQLQEKLNKSRQEIKGKEESIAKVAMNKPRSPADRPVSIFRAFMEQEYNPMRENDAKVMAIIQNYEEQKQKLTAELVNYRKEIDSLNSSMKKYNERSIEDSDYYNSKGRKTYTDPETQEKLKVLSNVISQLSLKTHLELPSAIGKIQQVMLTLPGIDKFVKQICEEIMINPACRLEEVIETLKDMKKKLHSLEKFKNSLSGGLGSYNDGDTMEKVKGLIYFCKLFEIKPRDDIIGAVESIFFFVHEIKMFLAFARKVLGLQSDCGVKVVLEEVMKIIQPEPVGYYR